MLSSAIDTMVEGVTKVWRFAEKQISRLPKLPVQSWEVEQTLEEGAHKTASFTR